MGGCPRVTSSGASRVGWTPRWRGASSRCPTSAGPRSPPSTCRAASVLEVDEPRQAHPHAGRRRRRRSAAHPAQPPPHGGLLARAPHRRAVGAAAAARTSSVRCSRTTPGRPSATSSACSTWSPPPTEDTLVGHLGPDVLGADWDADEALRRLRADPDRTVGEALLDQRNLAGIGTFFMTETLFLRGVTPWTPVRRRARSAGAGGPGAPAARRQPGPRRAGDHRRHPAGAHQLRPRPVRSAVPALRDGRSGVAPIGVAPQDRVAFYCPNCQRGPAPTDDGRPQRPLGASRR